MKPRLTEEQLQQYLDGTLSREEKRRVDQVLLTSPADRELLEEYRLLFGYLGDREVHSLAPAFIPEVLAEADSRQQAHLSRGAWLLGSGLLAVLITFVLASFVEMKPLWQSLAAYSQPVLQESVQIWDSVIGLFGSFGGTMMFLAAAGVILLAIQSLDRVLIAQRYERHLR